MNIAGVLSDQGKLVEAEEFYKKALTLEPQNADAHNNYGVFLGKMGQTTKALEKYKTALKLNPSHSVALVNMARQLRTSGNIHDAEKTYKRFVYILPQNPDLSHLVALVNCSLFRCQKQNKCWSNFFDKRVIQGCYSVLQRSVVSFSET